MSEGNNRPEDGDPPEKRSRPNDDDSNGAAATDTVPPTLDSQLKCPICLQILNEPSVTKCGHTFCQKCLRRSLNLRHRCPECDAEFKVDEVNAFPNNALDVLSRACRSHEVNMRRLRCHLPARADLLTDERTLNALAQQLLRQTGPTTDTGGNNDNDTVVDPHTTMDTMQRLLDALQHRFTHLQHQQRHVSSTLMRDFLDEMINRRRALGQQLENELRVLQSDRQKLTGAVTVQQQQQTPHLVPTSDSSTIQPSPVHSDSTVQLVKQPTTDSDRSTQSALADVSRPCDTAQLLLRCRQRLMKNFEDLEKEYITQSQDRINNSSIESSVVGDGVTPPPGLADFEDTLSKVTRYSGFNRLATLNYNNDFTASMSIVSSIEFDKDYEYFVVAGVMRQIKLYDFCSVVGDETGDIRCPIGHMQCDSKISCVSWNGYTKSLLVNSDYDGAVQLWDTWNQTSIRKFQEHERRCWTVHFSGCDPNVFASGSDDATVKLWSTNSPRSIQSIDARVNVCCVHFSPTSQYELVFGSADHCVHHYDIRNLNEPLRVLEGHKKAVSYVKYLSPTRVVSASTDSQLRLWDLSSGACLRVMTGHVNEKNFVGLSTDNGFIVSGSEQNSLFVYHQSVAHPLLRYNFDSAMAAPNGESLLADRRRRSHLRQIGAGATGGGDTATGTNDAIEFDSNVVIAANSFGETHILELV